MKVLLLLVLAQGDARTVVTERFPTVAACERAVTAIQELRARGMLLGSPPRGSYVCQEDSGG